MWFDNDNNNNNNSHNVSPKRTPDLLNKIFVTIGGIHALSRGARLLSLSKRSALNLILLSPGNNPFLFSVCLDLFQITMLTMRPHHNIILQCAKGCVNFFYLHFPREPTLIDSTPCNFVFICHWQLSLCFLSDIRCDRLKFITGRLMLERQR